MTPQIQAELLSAETKTVRESEEKIKWKKNKKTNREEWTNTEEGHFERKREKPCEMYVLTFVGLKTLDTFGENGEIGDSRKFGEANSQYKQIQQTTKYEIKDKILAFNQ